MGYLATLLQHCCCFLLAYYGAALADSLPNEWMALAVLRIELRYAMLSQCWWAHSPPAGAAGARL
jgi:hypothetical protein